MWNNLSVYLSKDIFLWFCPTNIVNGMEKCWFFNLSWWWCGLPLLEEMESNMIDYVKCSSYSQDDVNVFGFLWRSAFCNCFVNFAMNSSSRVFVFCSISLFGQCVCRSRSMQAGNLINKSLQLESRHSFRASLAWLVCCGVDLSHFGNVIKNWSIRPCHWSKSVTRWAAKGTCVALSMQKGAFEEISWVLSVAYR